MLGFQDNDVVLPITIIEELDRFKKRMEETGRNARQVSRMIDDLRKRGSLTQGISLDSGGTLRVALCHRETLLKLPPELEGDSDDNAILAVALELKHRCDCPVVLVSKDTNLRIKADTLGLIAEDYTTDKIDVTDFYTGIVQATVDPAIIEELREIGVTELAQPLAPNQAVVLTNAENPAHSDIATVEPTSHKVIPLPRLPKAGVSRIQPRNREQQFALNLLLNDAVPLVTLVGKAGTGKTLLAIAAGLQKVADEGHYSRLLIARPIVPMGRDLGYLPGDVGEKLTPWMQPLYDNFDLIFGTQVTSDRPSYWRRGHEELIERGLLQIEPLTYIRGRTLPQQFFVVDEAQNLTPHEVKTILTRAGEGTKIVLTGDVNQIDNPYVDAASNGLSYVVERFRSEPLAGHILLQRGERSPLAERASILL
ncbi:MAG: PhoH family protein [Leptolyngbyaceae cyanobacterium SL_1_1]|nr:PhoH family protein [Leptolyngbyaceae cyanobacterium SL_1_1]